MTSYDAQYLCDECLNESTQATIHNNKTYILYMYVSILYTYISFRVLINKKGRKSRSIHRLCLSSYVLYICLHITRDLDVKLQRCPEVSKAHSFCSSCLEWQHSEKILHLWAVYVSVPFLGSLSDDNNNKSRTFPSQREESSKQIWNERMLFYFSNSIFGIFCLFSMPRQFCAKAKILCLSRSYWILNSGFSGQPFITSYRKSPSSRLALQCVLKCSSFLLYEHFYMISSRIEKIIISRLQFLLRYIFLTCLQETFCAMANILCLSRSYWVLNSDFLGQPFTSHRKSCLFVSLLVHLCLN